jgi:glycerophosphoryl diester phosphodiesterase
LSGSIKTHSLGNTLPLGLQGHRGARGLFPENTIEGFQATAAMGVEAVELDVGMTSDGVVVVSHDLTLNPDIVRDTATGKWLTAPGPALRSLTLACLGRFDVGRLRPGSLYGAQFPDQRPHDGASVPKLEDVLRLLPRMRFTIELKTDPRFPGQTAEPAALAEATLAAIDTAGAADRVLIESFDWRGPRHVRRIRSEIRLAWLTRPETERNARLWWDGPHPDDFGGSVPRAVAAEGGPVWAPDHASLTRELIEEAHALGLQVLPWTVNDPNRMRRLHAWGVDGLITDRPDLWSFVSNTENSP